MSKATIHIKLATGGANFLWGTPTPQDTMFKKHFKISNIFHHLKMVQFTKVCSQKKREKPDSRSHHFEVGKKLLKFLHTSQQWPGFYFSSMKTLDQHGVRFVWDVFSAL